MAEEDKKKEETKPEVIVKQGGGKAVAVLIIIAIIVMIGGGIYAVFQSGSLTAPSVEEEEVQEITADVTDLVNEELVATDQATATVAAAATESAETLTPIEIDTDSENKLVKQAVLNKLGFSEEEVAFTISENTGTHAKGNIREVDAIGGAYWLAAKDQNGNWVLVYNGQANPPCEGVDLYDFTAKMVPECMDENNQLFVR